MQVISKEHTVFVDVDDTLVMTSAKATDYPDNKRVNVADPLTGSTLKLIINEPMVRLLKEEYKRGSHIVVWSRGGFEWARCVVTALGLMPYVHQVMTKPLVYMDDKDVGEWLPYRVYLSPDTIYKK